MGEINKSAPHDLIFSLDIGTRNVVGVLSKIIGQKYQVIDYEILEHPDRAMYDGQIHDISKVTLVVDKVKKALEERNGIELKYVAIAAAGRSLKTQKVLTEQNIDPVKEIDKAMIDSLEINGIQMAQKKLEEIEERDKSKYYCVGYTVVNYYLDDNVIGNLKAHRGRKIGAEILATFLPHVVVDSLYTVVHNIGLEVVNLTLEPIAAINIAIPPKFRLLNIALIDIGAGTSDIAITKNGAIVSYAMVSLAGDEITEALSQRYLMDFVTAEKLKIQLNKKDSHKFTDIVGISYEENTEEIISNIMDSIKHLSERIAEKILEYNGRAPSAVFCIGGGSQIPGLTECLAKAMDIPKERVVIRDIESLENIEFKGTRLKGPEYITPLGIGYTAFKDKEQDFLQVTINGKPIRLFNSRQLTVSDALILIGFNARKLLPKRGKSLAYQLNGNKKVAFGGYGEAAKIFLNGTIANLETRLKNKDVIIIEEATEGDKGEVYLKDLVNRDKRIYVNNEEIKLIRDITVNGEKRDIDYKINEDDDIYINSIENIRDLYNLMGLNNEDELMMVNGKKVDLDYSLKNGDFIQTHLKKNEEIATCKEEREKDNIKSKKINVKVNGETIDIEKKDNDPPIFVDIFNYIDFDLKKSNGILVLTLNGKRANFTDELKGNDEIQIYWR